MDNELETLGAHLRNKLTHYKNLLSIGKQLNIMINENRQDEKIYKKFYDLLIKELQIEDILNHLIDISYMDELENINWRNTKLYKENK